MCPDSASGEDSSGETSEKDTDIDTEDEEESCEEDEVVEKSEEQLRQIFDGICSYYNL